MEGLEGIRITRSGWSVAGSGGTRRVRSITQRRRSGHWRLPTPRRAIGDWMERRRGAIGNAEHRSP